MVCALQAGDAVVMLLRASEGVAVEGVEVHGCEALRVLFFSGCVSSQRTADWLHLEQVILEGVDGFGLYGDLGCSVALAEVV